MHKSITIILNPDTSDLRDVLSALLDEEGFEGIFEQDDSVTAYIPAKELSEEKLTALSEGMEMLSCELDMKIEEIQDQNWNSVWEKNFEPVVVDKLCAIRAPFHQHFPEVQHEITIEPKMSFGTGHHQTTRLIVEELFRMDFSNKKVLDMGCGTGILAILAAKLGGKDITAIDIDNWAYENTLENIKMNNCPEISVYKGSVEAIPQEQFEVIIANINRNILLDQIPEYSKHMCKTAELILSGILIEDESIILESAEKAGLSYKSSRSLDKWMMMIFQRN